MSTATTRRPRSARERILVTAEQMIAEQGVSVSLREIAAAAGQKNNSAVHYYFGSRDSLIEAIVDLRQESQERERMTLIAAQEAAGLSDLRSLLQALISPLFHAPYAEGATHYARFLEKVRDHPAVSLRPMTDNRWPATQILLGRIRRQLTDLPAPLLDIRLRAMMTTMFGLLADTERAHETGASALTRAAMEPHVVDMVHGLLTAAVTPPTS